MTKYSPPGKFAVSKAPSNDRSWIRAHTSLSGDQPGVAGDDHVRLAAEGGRPAARMAFMTSVSAKMRSSVPTPVRVKSLGLLIAVAVTAANVDDGRAAPEVFAQAPGRDFPRLKMVYADAKYHNYALYAWLRLHRRPYRIEVRSRPEGVKAFKPLKVRWVVERTFA